MKFKNFALSKNNLYAHYLNMRISPINFNTKSYSPNFGTTGKTKYEVENLGVVTKPFYDREATFLWPNYAKILVSNNTNFFRNDIPWDGFARKLNSLFPDGNKVNLYNFACSDGSEPYSLAICLIEGLGEEGAKRFFPIMASDIDSRIISKANSAKIFADNNDMQRLKKITKDNTAKYFDIKKTKGGYTLLPKDLLKNNVCFSKKDFLNGLDEIEYKNSLIVCRNFWAYMNEDEIVNSVTKLRKNIDKTTRILIGNFDTNYDGVPIFLKELGIESISKKDEDKLILKGRFNAKKSFCNEESIRKYIGKYCSSKLA